MGDLTCESTPCQRWGFECGDLANGGMGGLISKFAPPRDRRVDGSAIRKIEVNALDTLNCSRKRKFRGI